jgi:hypothetical protein
MRCIVSTSMKRIITILAATTFVQADCATPTPPMQQCPTKTQSVNYAVAGSCGGSGIITLLVPTAGSCDVSVVEDGNVIGLPNTGTFTPSAAQTGYKLALGGWTLEPPPTGMLGDNSGLNCSVSSATAAELTLTCSITICSVVGDDSEATCTVSGSCQAHLTPAPPGATPDLDAGSGVDASDDASSDAGAPRDASAG